MTGARAAWLPGGRLHLHHGPIDLVIEVEGPGRAAGYARAAARFQTVLDELVPELPRLRAPSGPLPSGTVARRMARAVAPFSDAVFVTPMAAVAGSVADEILAAILAGQGIAKAHVNNGGDIALHLSGDARAVALVASDPPARLTLSAGDRVGGVATSGWRGRSHSLGIADSVTVLAASAAAADAAATLIAGAVDLPGHPAVRRAPASESAPDSDLGDRPVTVAVGTLSRDDRARALSRGASFAADALTRGLILGAALVLQGDTRALGRAGRPSPEPRLPADAAPR